MKTGLAVLAIFCAFTFALPAQAIRLEVKCEDLFLSPSTLQKASVRQVDPDISLLHRALDPFFDISQLKRKDDVLNLERGFGYRLLFDDDITFQSAEYKQGLLALSGPTYSGYPANDRINALERFTKAFDAFNATENLSMRPIAFALTGSDANNLFVDIASAVVSLKKGARTRGKVLVFDKSYVASRGELAQFRFFDRGNSTGPWSKHVIGAPLVEPQDIDDPSPLNEKERAALKFILKTVRAEGDIGGIFIEPIVGAAGVYAYRTAFIQALRKLADRLEIPILADEVLAGGGRTGRNYGFSHYKGFKPDYVTIGKGVGATAIAEVLDRDSRGQMSGHYTRLHSQIVDRSSEINYPEWWHLSGPTLIASASSLWTSAHILERITNDRLQGHAQVVGRYFLEQLQLYAQLILRRDMSDIANRPRGLGMMLYLSDIGPAMGRFLPALTMTSAEVDQYMRVLLVTHLAKDAAPAEIENISEQIAALKLDWRIENDRRKIEEIVARVGSGK